MIFQRQSDVNLEDIVELVLLIIVIILVAIFLYLSIKFVTETDYLDNNYIIRLFVVSFVIVVLVALVISAIVDVLDPIPFVSDAAQQLVPILIFLAIVYLIKYFLIPERDESGWDASWEGICVAILTLFLIYFLNSLVLTLFDIEIISGI